MCNIHCNDAEDKCLNSDDTIILSEEDDEKATGKSSDEYGLFSEHFKSGKSEIVPAITKVFNIILSEKKIPSIFQDGRNYPCTKERQTRNYWKTTVELPYPQYLATV